MTNNTLHIYAQKAWHDHAWITGTRPALEALIATIRTALDSGVGATGEFVVNDGEAYVVDVTVDLEALIAKRRVPYTDPDAKMSDEEHIILDSMKDQPNSLAYHPPDALSPMFDWLIKILRTLDAGLVVENYWEEDIGTRYTIDLDEFDTDDDDPNVKPHVGPIRDALEYLDNHGLATIDEKRTSYWTRKTYHITDLGKKFLALSDDKLRFLDGMHNDLRRNVGASYDRARAESESAKTGYGNLVKTYLGEDL